MATTLKRKGRQSEDVHVLGASTTWEAVLGAEKTAPDWLGGSPVSRELARHSIAHAGIMKARAPFRIVRHDQSGTFLMACLRGEGEVLSDGGWRVIRAGQACLMPPWVMNSFHCKPGGTWEFAWVRYLESRETNPVVSAHSPVFGKYDGEPLRHGISGLRAEALDTAAPAAMGLWSELINGYVTRFAQPHRRDSRLWKLWKAVDDAPARSWSLNELAEVVAMSSEHLRRICAKELGRSPMQQVTFIRMQKASHLLATSEEKIETVCRAVGYSSVQTFSTTFLKWMGRRPSEHRR
jgi:AraC-like DNA-binding protein